VGKALGVCPEDEVPIFSPKWNKPDPYGEKERGALLHAISLSKEEEKNKRGKLPPRGSRKSVGDKLSPIHFGENLPKGSQAGGGKDHLF